MPPSTKKKRSASSGSRNRAKKGTSTSKKKRPKSRSKQSKKTKKNHLQTSLSGIVRWVAIALIIFLLGYCFGRCLSSEDSYKNNSSLHSSTKTKTVQAPKKADSKPSTIPKPSPKPVQKKEKEHPQKRVKVVKKEEIQVKKEHKPKVEKKRDENIEKKTIPHKQTSVVKLAYRGSRPKLAIIIDDVHTQKQINAIKAIGMPVTPAIFPPYTLAPHTPRLARGVVHYMVHLPMESGNAKYDKQSKTLKVHDTKYVMQQRIKELRHLFPRAHFINNHTGSRFTQDTNAMKRLYHAMKQEGFAFIDSRTTPKSVVGHVVHAQGDDYVARDIFLDNHKEQKAILRQLQKAVKLAKKNGYAIAIGHPYSVTLQTLKKAKPLLKEVEVVYIEKLFRRYE